MMTIICALFRLKCNAERKILVSYLELCPVNCNSQFILTKKEIKCMKIRGSIHNKFSPSIYIVHTVVCI